MVTASQIHYHGDALVTRLLGLVNPPPPLFVVSILFRRTCKYVNRYIGGINYSTNY